MPELPKFPDARFYSCTDPETLSCTEPDEAIEECLDSGLDPKMTAAEVLASIRERELIVTCYDPTEISDKQIEVWAESCLEHLGEAFADEHGDPDGGPCDQFPDDSEKVMRDAVASIIRRSHVWSCREIGKVTLSPDQIEAWVRANRPDWLEDQIAPKVVVRRFSPTENAS